MTIVFITCKSVAEAKKIGQALLKKRLAACVGIIPKASSMYFWSPRKNKIEKNSEAILLVKTLRKKFPHVEKEVKKLHSYKIPCILEIPVSRLNKSYQKWLEGQIK